MTKEAGFKKVGENTVIQLTLKNFLWTLGGILFVISNAVWLITNIVTNKMDKIDERVKVQQEQFVEWQEKKFEPHIEDAHQMKSDISVLIDRGIREKNYPAINPNHLSSSTPPQ